MTPPDTPGAPLPGGALPVLTEVVEWPATGQAADSGPPYAEAPDSDAVPATPAAAAPDSVAPGPELTLEDARSIEDAVLAELQQRIDLMFEYRLRETLAPTLARVTDLLIREAREEVALTLRDVVSRAVAQEIGRRRQRR